MQNVINQFTTLAKSERCRFIGNVQVGVNVLVAQLRSMYSAVVLVSQIVLSSLCQATILVFCIMWQKAYGAEADKYLGIPGEVYTCVCVFCGFEVIVQRPIYFVGFRT